MPAKLCVNCAYIRGRRSNPMCAASGAQMDVVLGGFNYLVTAASMRSDDPEDGLCGPEAKLFQPYKTWWLGIGKNPNEHSNEVK